MTLLEDITKILVMTRAIQIYDHNVREMVIAMTPQGSCLAGLTHLGAALLVLLGFVLVLLAYRLVRRDGRVKVDEAEAKRTEDINKDDVEKGGGEDNLGYKTEPDSEDK